MMEKTPIIPQRVRRINGSFAFIEHRFLPVQFTCYTAGIP